MMTQPSTHKHTLNAQAINTYGNQGEIHKCPGQVTRLSQCDFQKNKGNKKDKSNRNKHISCSEKQTGQSLLIQKVLRLSSRDIFKAGVDSLQKSILDETTVKKITVFIPACMI